MAILASQTTLEALRDGQQVVRASQAVLETLHNDATPLVRASQAVLEALHDDSVFQVRASQAVLEVLCSLNGFVGYVSIAGGG